MARILFPYATVRRVQDRLMALVAECIEQRKDLIVHAPTGLGKTVATLAPALGYAKEHDSTILFLTSRHTQHHLAVETAKDIIEATGEQVRVTDIVGKKWMCPQAGAGEMYSGEFAEYCRKLREEGTCEFYSRTRLSNRLTVDAEQLLGQLNSMVQHTEQIVSACATGRLCPYEITLCLARNSELIVADYYYLFHPTIRELFLNKAQKELANCIVIVDEAHNLPPRLRHLASSRLSSVAVSRAIGEARRFGYRETLEQLKQFEQALSAAAGLKTSGERLVRAEQFTEHLGSDYAKMVSDLQFIADAVRERQRQSYIGTVSAFLEQWPGEDEGYARIARKEHIGGRDVLSLSKICLDPSQISRQVNQETHSMVLMSGTLTPTAMYRDMLGFPDPKEASFPSPFPAKNRLSLIVPITTTRYSARSEQQYNRIAIVCGAILDAVPGNTLLLFPSYSIRDSVLQTLPEHTEKRLLLEKQNLSKADKAALLEDFKSHNKRGAGMLAVASGSFAEGIDLPGDLLRCVVVVGLPFQQPDLETTELVKYYEGKFGKGWEYGYLFPAFNKVLQGAGRCIRSETDRGMVIFLDERYIWPRYRGLFPKEWNPAITKDVIRTIEDFY